MVLAAMGKKVVRRSREDNSREISSLEPGDRVLLADLLSHASSVSIGAYSGLRLSASAQRQVGENVFEADAVFEVPKSTTSELPLPLPSSLTIRYTGAAALRLYGGFAGTLVEAGEPFGSARLRQIESVEWVEAS